MKRKAPQVQTLNKERAHWYELGLASAAVHIALSIAQARVERKHSVVAALEALLYLIQPQRKIEDGKRRRHT